VRILLLLLSTMLSCPLFFQWHLGFQSWDYTPIMRGWHSYYGYLSGGEDYFNHKAGGFVDLTEAHVIENGTVVNGQLPFEHHAIMDADGSYSTQLFANRTIDLIRDHAANHAEVPFFLYLAFQSVHSPLQVQPPPPTSPCPHSRTPLSPHPHPYSSFAQAPQEYIDKYDYITNKNRRTLAAMSTCMDDEIKKIAQAAKAAGMWANSVFAFVADNGGPPYVANSNWPMRGGKWTVSE
jgi:arylsulfatase B/arylsulfatase I/J